MHCTGKCFSAILYLLLALCGCGSLYAQVLPAENSELNYLIAGFTDGSLKNGETYLIEIAAGINNNEEYFKKNTIIRGAGIRNQFYQSLPSFKSSYTWRITSFNDKGKQVSRSKLHHFSTGYSIYADTAKYRLRTLQPGPANQTIFACIDASRNIYNLYTGQPVWYLPDIPGIVTAHTIIRDMEVTPQGTITFIADEQVCEVDYNGKVLWKGRNDGRVNKDTSEFYHHEFTRLQNGHYMVSGNEKLPLEPGNVQNRMAKPGYRSVNILCGTLIEYDSLHNIIWSWRSSQAFTQQELLADIAPTAGIINNRLNAFYVDEQKQEIHISFRDMNKIIRIAYPTGKLLATTQPGLFFGQHHCTLTPAGDLLLFNNNVAPRSTKGVPAVSSSVLKIRATPGKPDSFTKEWEYFCSTSPDTLQNAARGGSVSSIGNNTYLVYMGTINRLFVVGEGNRRIWDALIEMNMGDNKWEPLAGYRASVIKDSDFFKLNFNTQKAN